MIARIWHAFLDHLRIELIGALVPVFVLWIRKFFNNNKEEEVMELNKDLGKELKLHAELKGLVANISLEYAGLDGVKAELKLEVPAKVFLEKLKKAIPGNIDDVLIDLGAGALEKL